MPEEISAHITIGGRFPRVLVPELCQLICEEGVGLDWCGKAFEPVGEQDLLAAVDAYSRNLRLFADCAAWGEFQSLEQFLEEHQIPFDRHHESKYEIACTTQFYRPDQGRLEFLTDEGEQIVCRAKPLRPVTAMLAQAHADAKRGRSQEAAFLIDECLQKLQEHLPPEIALLPALEIV